MSTSKSSTARLTMSGRIEVPDDKYLFVKSLSHRFRKNHWGSREAKQGRKSKRIVLLFSSYIAKEEVLKVKINQQSVKNEWHL